MVAKHEPRLPWQQLLILSICRFAEPIASTSVFPYLPEMIESFGVEEDNVAQWAGTTSAIFSMSQACTGLLWGRASDYYGRRPVILIGLCITMSASLLFGFSRSLSLAIVARAISGGSAGTVGIIRTTVAEMVPYKELQPRAFSIMPLVWTTGSIIGPVMGGILANPARTYPSVFGRNELFIAFPYLLPNLVAAVFFCIGITTGILFFKETLATRKDRKDPGLALGDTIKKAVKQRSFKSRYKDDEVTPLLKGSTKPSEPSEPPPRYREVFTVQSSLNLLAYMILALHSIAYDQLLPVFLHHPCETEVEPQLPFRFAEGFGLNSDRIGILFTAYGFVSMALQFLVFPPLARYFGVLKCLRMCFLLFPIVYVVTPYTVFCPTDTTRQIAVFAVMVLKSWSICFAFPCSTILLTNSATSLRLLATLNGFATTISALGRAIGPFLSGSLFTIGVKRGYVILPWFVLAAIAIVGLIPTIWIVELEGFGDTDDSDSDEEEEDARASVTRHGPQPQQLDGGPDERTAAAAVDIDAAAQQLGALEEEVEGYDEFAVSESPEDSQRLARMRSATSIREGPSAPRKLRRRRSNPIGIGEPVGPGGGRKYSNSLGHSRSGYGYGGDVV